MTPHQHHANTTPTPRHHSQLEKIAAGDSLLTVKVRVKADPIDTERLVRRKNANLKHFITYDAWKASDDALAKVSCHAEVTV